MPLLLIATVIMALSCQKKTSQCEAESFPTFWTWLDYHPGMNFDSICQVMEEIGMDGIMLNAPTPDDYRVAVPIAHKHGIEVHAWLWTMCLEHDRAKLLKEHPEWFEVNRLGESLADKDAYVDYYKFLTPALPEVREYLKNKIKAYCEVEGLNGIAYDYHRMVDVVLPTTLWKRYDVVQDKEYAEFDYGYHPAMIEKFKSQYGYDPREQEDPAFDETWRQFRCDQISEVANEFSEIIHSYGKAASASPFPTPKMAMRMVRQEWSKWDLDIVFPMVYHNFYTADTTFFRDCMLDATIDKNEKTTLGCGMTATDGPHMFECMDAAFHAGAQAISVFTVNGLKSQEVRNQFRAYTDSIKAVKAANGGKIIPCITGEPPRDLLTDHESLLNVIRGKMAQIAGVEAVQVDTFTYMDEENVTKRYEAVDALTGKKFILSVWHWGDIISGWDVVLAE